ncbi:helix-turn-helix domain-containing protein [Bilophila wadsworthia]|uniref:helix-turn-helix domain-containing protein n=1 Tax=Bilophila wadsworthia TaxID=35833 RepID=UPI00351FAE7A
MEDFSTQKSGFEKKLIAEALEQYGGDIKNTASFLHIPLSTMYNKVKRYNLLPQRLKTPE